MDLFETERIGDCMNISKFTQKSQEVVQGCEKIAMDHGHQEIGHPQWQGDDITTNPGSNKQAAAEMDKFAPTNSNKGVKDCWNRHYEIIKAANLIINNGDKTPTSEEEKNIAIGQARYWSIRTRASDETPFSRFTG